MIHWQLAFCTKSFLGHVQSTIQRACGLKPVRSFTMTSSDCSHMEGSAKRLELYLMGLCNPGSQILVLKEGRNTHGGMQAYMNASLFRMNRYRALFIRLDTKQLNHSQKHEGSGKCSRSPTSAPEYVQVVEEDCYVADGLDIQGSRALRPIKTLLSSEDIRSCKS